MAGRLQSDNPTGHARRTFIIAGVTLALVGPGIVAIFSNAIATSPETLPPRVLSLVIFACLLVAVAYIATHREGNSLRSLGFEHQSARSVVFGLLLASFFIVIFGPLVYWILLAVGLQGFDGGLSMLHELPIAYVIITVLIVGAGEEWLYRAYAIERLESLTGSTPIAVLVSLFAFAIVHYPLWGLGPALTTLVSGAILAGLYVWTRDIVMLIIAHVATDLYGIVIVSIQQ